MARPPKTLTEHRKNGTERRDRHGMRAEARFAHGAPVQPSELSDVERQLWDSVIANTPDMVLTSQDAYALFDASKWWGLIRSIGPQISNDPTNADLMKQYQTASNMFMRYQAKFGLSPVDRARIKLTEAAEPESDPFAAIVKMTKTG